MNPNSPYQGSARLIYVHLGNDDGEVAEDELKWLLAQIVEHAHLQNDVIVCMCAWYYWGESREGVKGQYGVEGDVRSAFAQFEQNFRAFELAVKTAEEAE